MPQDSVHYKQVEHFLNTYANYKGVFRGRETWKGDTLEVISIDKDQPIDLTEFMLIAAELNIPPAELDYFMGENGIA